jgi:dTDP-glucose pyrophosphorylase
MDSALKKICVAANVSIKTTVDVLNAGHKRIVLVVNNEKLIGVVSDSDIRRALLREIPFTRPVSEIMVKNPVVVTPDMTDRGILVLMKRTHVYQIPVIDYEGKLLGLKLIEDLLLAQPRAEAFVLAGGLGTRLLPITKRIPKSLIQVGGKEILFTILDGLIEAGIKRITLALNYKADMIKRAIERRGKYAQNIVYLNERKKLGTAGSLSMLPDLPDVPLLVINGDILTKVDYGSMLSFHQLEQNKITVAVRTERIQIPFGVPNIQGTQIIKMEEKPEISFFINAGIYILDPSILNSFKKRQKLDMTDLLSHSIKRQHRVGCFPVHEYWLDVGRPSELKRAMNEFKHHFKAENKATR